MRGRRLRELRGPDREGGRSRSRTESERESGANKGPEGFGCCGRAANNVN
jgi:hypothetical protein